MNKRSNFYPNGEIIDFRLPQDFRPSSGRGSCGNCGQYSNKRSFCNIYKSFGVKDVYVCNQWRQRHFRKIMEEPVHYLVLLLYHLMVR